MLPYSRPEMLVKASETKATCVLRIMFNGTSSRRLNVCLSLSPPHYHMLRQTFPFFQTTQKICRVLHIPACVVDRIHYHAHFPLKKKKITTQGVNVFLHGWSLRSQKLNQSLLAPKHTFFPLYHKAFFNLSTLRLFRFFPRVSLRTATST